MRSNMQIISDHYAASGRADIDGMMADVAPDARWTEMAGFPCAGTWIGPAQIVEHVFKVLGSDLYAKIRLLRRYSWQSNAVCSAIRPYRFPSPGTKPVCACAMNKHYVPK